MSGVLPMALSPGSGTGGGGRSPSMVSAAEQLAANLNFGALAKADELKKRIWFTLGALLVYRLGTYIPLPGIDPNTWEQVFQLAGRRHSRHVQHVRRRRHPPHGDLRAEHHAVHLGLDHHPASDHRLAAARSAEEGRRGGPQDAEPVHPLSDRDPGRCSRPTASPSALQGAGNVVSEPGMFFLHLHGRSR